MQENVMARKYVTSIDKRWRRREKIMHELVDKIERSGLLKKNMRDEINQMILANFLRKEKEEKGTERYKSLKLIFKKEQERYEELEKLRVQLREKEKEEILKEEELKGIPVLGISDVDTLKVAKSNVKKVSGECKKLKESKDKIQKQIDEIEKELEEIEREYGRKIDQVKDEDSNMGDEKKSGDGNTENKSKDVEETGEITVKDMEKKDEVRLEILKLLRKSERMDKNLKTEIKEIISDGYVAKFMDMKGSLEYGGVNVLLDRNKIGGKFVYKVKTRDGKWEIYRGEKKICNGCDEIGIIWEYGGKPLFKVEQNGKWSIYCGDEEICYGCDEIEEMETEKGEVIFKTKRSGKWNIYRGKEEICKECDEIEQVENVGKEIIFKVKKDSKLRVYGMGRRICDDCDKVRGYGNAGGAIFEIEKGGKKSMYWKGIQICEGYDAIKVFENEGGRPVFQVINIIEDEQMQNVCQLSVYRGEKQICNGFDEIEVMKNNGGERAILIKERDQYSLYLGERKICEGCREIKVIKDDGGDLTFKVKKNWEFSIYQLEGKIGGEYDEIKEEEYVGGKIFFVGEYKDKYDVYWGKKRIGRFKRVKEIKIIDGKPAFIAENLHGKFSVYRGNEEVLKSGGYIDEFVKIGDDFAIVERPDREKSLHHRVRFRDWTSRDFRKITELRKGGGKPIYDVEFLRGGGKAKFWGDEQVRDFQLVRENAGGKPLINVRKRNRKWEVYRGEKLICEGIVVKMRDRRELEMLVDKGEGLEIRFSAYIGEKEICSGLLCKEGVKDFRIERENVGGKSLISVQKLNGKWEVYRGEKLLSEGRVLGIEEKCGESVVWVSKGEGLEKRFSAYIGEKEICSGKDLLHVEHALNKLLNCEEEKNGANEGEKQDVEKKHGECEEKTVIKNDKIEEKEKEEKNNERNGNTNSQIEKREKFILEWYIKKRNRDDLFNILDLCIIDRKKRKEIKDIVFKDFEKNYEEASSDEEIKTIGENYKKLRGIERQIEREREGHIVDMINLYENLYEFAKMEMEVDRGDWTKKIKLIRKRKEGKDLELRQREILEGLEKLIEQKLELEEKVGKRRKVKISKEVEGIERFREYKSNSGGEKISPKEYIELYEEMIRYKRENMEGLIEEIGKMDIGMGEEVKEDVKERIRKAMSEEIEDMKRGSDERLKIAMGMKKTLEEKVQKYKDYISELEIKIVKKQEELNMLDGQREGSSVEQYQEILTAILNVQEEIMGLKNEKNNIERNLEEEKDKYENNKLM